MKDNREPFNRLFAARFLSASNFGVLIVNAEFQIVEINEPVCRMFGMVREDWIGRSAVEWLVETGWHSLPFDRSLLQGRTFHGRATDWGVGDRYRSLLLDGDILQEKGSESIVGAYVLFQDVSQLKLLEEQIRRSDQLKTMGQIAAGTAHEIRNPLTAIRGFMQLLEKSLANRGMMKEGEFVQVMMSELDRINVLASEFLLLSKPRSFKAVKTSSNSIIEELLPVISGEALLHGVAVQYEPGPGIYAIQVDKEQLKQVILNLAKNAIEAMDDGGTLIIQEMIDVDTQNRVRIAIQDTGPGISPEVMERIFDPFFTTKQQGTGLGLSICQKIIHDLGGQIEVSSSQEGTRFTISLPIAGLLHSYKAELSG